MFQSGLCSLAAVLAPSARRLQLELLVAAAAWALSSVCATVSHDTPSWDLSELESRLSENASVIYPNDTAAFDLATSRWSLYSTPTISVVVVPGVENDVAETVKYAADRNISFLAVNGGHGAITTVGRMTSGIEIWMHRLQSVEISDDGYDRRRCLVHERDPGPLGCGQADSILGPGLGGGHGWLQGRHGLVSDQFVSVNIVLADGSLRTIDDSSDLWWAIQGAGHNFGIVTSVTSRIYDAQYPDWSYKSYVFTGDKFTAVFTAVNDHLLKNGTHLQPVDVASYGNLYNDPATSDEPILKFFVLQEGTTAVDPTYTAPFDGLGPTATDAGAGSYPDIPTWTGMSLADGVCQLAAGARVRFPIDVGLYNATALQRVYDLFAAATRATPALGGSRILLEGYATRALRAVPDASTAVSYRGDNLLLSPVMAYAGGGEGGGEGVDAAAAEAGEAIRRALHEGTGRRDMHTYVNYAYGTETSQMMYGHEQWRQDRLLALKDKYDPQRRFSFYAPIAV